MAQRTIRTVGDLRELLNEELKDLKDEQRVYLKDGESEARHTLIFDAAGDAGLVLNHTQ